MERYIKSKQKILDNLKIVNTRTGNDNLLTRQKYVKLEIKGYTIIF
jgi:hypothetical protein